MKATSSTDVQTIKKKKGEVLFKKGDDANHLYIIKSGKVIIIEEIEKSTFPVDIIGAGGFVGSEILFKQEIQDLMYSYSAVVLENVEYVRVEIRDIYKILNTLPAWMSRLLCTLDERLYDSLDSLIEHKLIKKFAIRHNEVSDKTLSEIISKIR